MALNKEAYQVVSSVYKRVEKFDTAIRKVNTFANDLQRGDFSHYPTFNPYGPKNNFLAKRDKAREAIVRVKENSVPSLNSMKEDALKDISTQETLGMFFRYRRMQMGMSFREVCMKGGLDIKNPKSLSHVETSYRKIPRKYLEAYQKAGVDIPRRLLVRNFTGKDYKPPETLNEFLHFARLINGLTFVEMGRLMNYSPGSLAGMEEGKKRVSRRILLGYQRILGIKAPKALISLDQEQRKATIREKYERLIAKQLKEHEAQKPPEENRLGFFLRLVRLRARMTAAQLAEKTGYTPTSISFSEKGKNKIISEYLLDAYENLFEITIPEDLREENRRRQKELNKRKGQGIKKYKFGARETA